MLLAPASAAESAAVWAWALMLVAAPTWEENEPHGQDGDEGDQQDRQDLPFLAPPGRARANRHHREPLYPGARLVTGTTAGNWSVGVRAPRPA